MTKLTIGDRVASAFVGAAIGSVLGVAMTWLLGVYSNTLGPSQIGVSFVKLTGAVALGFAILGFAIGPKVGTALGNTISGIFEFERALDNELPSWVVILVLAGIVFCAWWFLR